MSLFLNLIAHLALWLLLAPLLPGIINKVKALGGGPARTAGAPTLL